MTTTQLPAVPDPRTRRHRSRWLAGAVATTAVAGGFVASTQLSHEGTTSSVSGVREVLVDIGAGPVTLHGGQGDAVEIRSTPHGPFTTSSAPRHEAVDGVLRITSACSGVALHCWTREEITVPPGVPVRVHTGVGDVTAIDLDVPTFTVDAGAATVTASFVRAPEEVRIDVATAGNVAIAVPEAEYEVDTDATVGTEDVRVDPVPSAPRRIHATTGVGNVSLGSR